jgi:hypothetical protein
MVAAFGRVRCDVCESSNAHLLQVESADSWALLYGGRPGLPGPVPQIGMSEYPAWIVVVQFMVCVKPSEVETEQLPVQVTGPGPLFVA